MRRSPPPVDPLDPPKGPSRTVPLVARKHWNPDALVERSEARARRRLINRFASGKATPREAERAAELLAQWRREPAERRA